MGRYAADMRLDMHANLADDSSSFVWHADTEGFNFREAFRDTGFYFSGCCIRKKNALVLNRSPFLWIHNPACLAGSRPESINGTRIASKKSCGSTASRALQKAIPR